jgi:hypothetical protein
MSCTDNLTLREIRELKDLFNNTGNNRDDSHWQVGKSYIIRTVTMILTGRLEKVTEQELVLSSAAWIAETDRYTQTIKEGKLREVEPYGDNNVIVGRGALIDATIWTHPLPREQR